MGIISEDGEITGPSGPRPPVTWSSIEQRDERIHQLEKQCSVLAAEVDAMRPVVEAAVKAAACSYCNSNDNADCVFRAGLKRATTTYQAAKEQG